MQREKYGKQVTVQLPDELANALKDQAKSTGQSLKRIYAAAGHVFLNMPPAKQMQAYQDVYEKYYKEDQND